MGPAGPVPNDRAPSSPPPSPSYLIHILIHNQVLRCRSHGGMSALHSPYPFATELIRSQALLDFSREFDVSLLDRVAMAFYTRAGQEVRICTRQRYFDHDADLSFIGL